MDIINGQCGICTPIFWTLRNSESSIVGNPVEKVTGIHSQRSDDPQSAVNIGEKGEPEKDLQQRDECKRAKSSEK